MKELNHRLFGIEHPFVHIHVNDLRAVLNLLTRNRYGLFVLATQDELCELRRASDIGPFANVHEVCIRANRERFKTTETQVRFDFGWNAPGQAAHCIGDGLYVRRRGTTAAAYKIQPAVLGPIAKLRGQRFRRLRKTCRQQRIGQARIRIAANINWRDGGQLLDQWPHLLWPKRAVHSDAHQRHVRNRIPERFDRLAGHAAIASSLYKCYRRHHGHAAVVLLEIFLDREECRLRIERVENRLNQQDVRAAIQQTVDLLAIRSNKLVISYATCRRIVNVR